MSKVNSFAEDNWRERDKEAQEDGLRIEFPEGEWIEEGGVAHYCPRCGDLCRCPFATYGDASGTARECTHRCDG